MELYPETIERWATDKDDMISGQRLFIGSIKELYTTTFIDSDHCSETRFWSNYHDAVQCADSYAKDWPECYIYRPKDNIILKVDPKESFRVIQIIRANEQSRTIKRSCYQSDK